MCTILQTQLGTGGRSYYMGRCSFATTDGEYTYFLAGRGGGWDPTRSTTRLRSRLGPHSYERQIQSVPQCARSLRHQYSLHVNSLPPSQYLCRYFVI